MATTSLSIKRLGVSVSAVLAVPYMVIMLASLFVLGVSTTGSWQAVCLAGASEGQEWWPATGHVPQQRIQ